MIPTLPNNTDQLPSVEVTDLPAPDRPAEHWAWVAAAPFRAHVRQVLTIEPLPWRAFAGHARVPDNVLKGLLGVRRRRVRRIAPHYARALLTIEARTLRAELLRPVDPAEAVDAAGWLLDSGWSVTEIARAGSLAHDRLRSLLAGSDLLIARRTELLLAAAARGRGYDPVESRADASPRPVAA